MIDILNSFIKSLVFPVLMRFYFLNLVKFDVFNVHVWHELVKGPLINFFHQRLIKIAYDLIEFFKLLGIIN